MKTSVRHEDFKIYVEDEDTNYIMTSFIHESEGKLDQNIDFKVKLVTMKEPFTIKLTQLQIITLSTLLAEVVTHFDTQK